MLDRKNAVKDSENVHHFHIPIGVLLFSYHLHDNTTLCLSLTSPFRADTAPSTLHHCSSGSFRSSPNSPSHHGGPGNHNQEDPKPQQSYIGLISMAILSAKEHKLVLADIYQYILDNYAYFRHRGPGWRNSIRHNLSLNDCFIKAGRAANGKGHYWAIHPACKEDFQRGDYRRRKAQRKVRRHMGLTVEEEDSPSPPPPPTQPPPISGPPSISSSPPAAFIHNWGLFPSPPAPPSFPIFPVSGSESGSIIPPRKRQFDVASLLRPKSPVEELDETPPTKIHPPFLPWLVDQSHQEYFAKYYQSLLGAPVVEEELVVTPTGRRSAGIGEDKGKSLTPKRSGRRGIRLKDLRQQIAIY
ncbi:unnamed protein product [Lepeophtheirus salmonis]|uniref:(salmon louse) hypothetical protein n=1 Tax=Lepeophtheirus salmonis TaxID=72036 RepID=A0A7R8CKF0_LEPSM|nr:unnamed protein product [Lepeophtheirus salmonis]CAF2848402.1 unnamed protein product [Lepeophtheirus salmonis]